MRYSIARAREAGGLVALTRRLATHNACKTCAVGMSGMRNERGSFPEVCKKSVQAQAADMQPPIDEAFFRANDLETLARWSSRELEAAGRLGFPIVCRPGERHYRRIAWDDALDLAAGALRAVVPDRTFFYASGRSSNEAAFLLQCFARAYGTNNVNNCSYYCHQASSVALTDTIGSGTATISLDDLEQADFVLLVGANPASNHPRLISQLVTLRRRGGHVVVINPLREVGLVRFRVPSDWRSMLFGSDVSDLLSAAAHRRRHSPPDAAAAGSDRPRRRRRRLRARPHGGLGGGAGGGRRPSRGTRCSRRAESPRRTSSVSSTSCAGRGGVSWRGAWG